MISTLIHIDDIVAKTQFSASCLLFQSCEPGELRYHILDMVVVIFI